MLNILAVDIVRSLQHFVSRITTSIWKSRKDVALLNSTTSTSSIQKSTIPPSNEYNLHDLNYKTRGLIGQPSSTNPLKFNKDDIHISELASILWLFLDELFVKMRECPLWSGETIEQFEQSKSDCEKFVFLKLYEPLFQIATAGLEDQMANQRTHERIESLQFLSAEHLDIRSLRFLTDEKAASGTNTMNGRMVMNESLKGTESRLLTEPIAHLRALEYARSPEDKLQCVKRCSIAIAQLLKAAHLRKNSLLQQSTASNPNLTSPPPKSSAPGADELLPVMILTLKCCNPHNIHSNIKYLQHFLRPARMVSEAGYLLTNLVSAVYFLDNVDAQALTIEPEEFDRAILRCKQQAKDANMKLLKDHPHTRKGIELGLKLGYGGHKEKKEDEKEFVEGDGEVDGVKELFERYKEETNRLSKQKYVSVVSIYKGMN